MNRNWKRGCQVWGILLGITASSTVVPAPGAVDVQNLLDRSDLVIRGTVRAVVTVGGEQVDAFGISMSKTNRRAAIEVDRAYKGNPSSPISLLFDSLSNPNVIQQPVSVGQHVLLFLSSKGDGTYVYADHYFGRFYPSPELANPMPGVRPARQLEADLESGLKDPDRDRVFTNIELLQGFSHLDSLEEVAPLVRYTDPAVVSLAYAVLLKNHDFSRNSQLLAFLEGLPLDPNFSLAELADSIQQLTAQPEQLVLLIRLSSSKHKIVKTSAMYALRDLKSAMAVPAMVSRLDDADLYVRFAAVRILSETTGLSDPDHSPDLPSFEREGQKYIDIWKTWWSEEGQQSYRQR